MIGQRIEGRAGPIWPMALFVLIALVLVAWAAAARLPAPAVVATLPLAIAGALWWTRQSSFVADVTSEGLELHEPPFTLRYEEIDGLTRQSARGPKFDITVHHASGTLVIPSGLNVISRELFGFLTEQLPQQVDRPLPAPLDQYRQRQELDFGPERVHSFRVRPPSLGKTPVQRTVAVSLAFVAAGVIWIVAGAALGNPKSDPALIGFGVMLVFGGLIFALVFRFGRRRPDLHKLQQSGLVISPIGLALIQGKLRGEMRWDELRNVTYLKKKPKFFMMDATSRHFPGVCLVVEGATIVVADIYDRPLDTIHQQLLDYWKGVSLE